MAEFYMKELVRSEGLADIFHIESAATSTEEIWNGMGSPIYGPAAAELRRHGIPYDKNKRARLLTKRDYAAFDYIIGMDGRNRASMRRLFGGDPDGKVSLLLDFTDHPRDVADPWYTGNFDTAYRDIEEGCRAFLAWIWN